MRDKRVPKLICSEVWVLLTEEWMGAFQEEKNL